MNDSIQKVADQRRRLLARMFPQGLPGLWCPSLTHYDATGTIDRARISAHLAHMSKWVKGFLIPGSTGDGWELTDVEARQVTECALENAARLKVQVLVGVLKPDAERMIRGIRDMVDWCDAKTNDGNVESSLTSLHVAGVTICPPHGKDLTQEQIGAAMASVLKSGVPTALYQLPQVTQNEMSPEVLADLAARFPNFYLFKDTSGGDRVAMSGKPLPGVFLVRGAEGDYARWLKASGGPYDGFLLSTANSFARELYEVLDGLKAGRVTEAEKLSVRLSTVVKEVFEVVRAVPQGNAFANANKAMDHFFAHGPKAATVKPPRLHAGVHLPVEMVRAAGEALTRHGFMPAKGYLE